MYRNSTRSTSVATGLLAVALLLVLSSVSRAQLPHFHIDLNVAQRGADNSAVWFEKATDLEGIKPSSHWMGIAVHPIDPLLQKHLRIEGGLIVQQVTEDSPAAQAGVQVDDILLSVNDVEVADFKGLMEFLTKNQGQEVTVKLLREGKQRALKVTPVERPEGHAHIFPPSELQPSDVRNKTPEEIRKWMQEMAEKGAFDRGQPADGNPLRMRFFHPGVILGKGDRFDVERNDLPKDLKVIVIKTGDEPAVIKIYRGDDEWEVSEKDLDKLPEEVRDHVKKYVRHGTRLGMRVEAPQAIHISPTEGEHGLPRVWAERLQIGGSRVANQLDEINARLEKIEQALEKLTDE